MKDIIYEKNLLGRRPIGITNGTLTLKECQNCREVSELIAEIEIEGKKKRVCGDCYAGFLLEKELKLNN